MLSNLVRYQHIEGQSVDKTAYLFALMNKTGICPMPRLVHHDSQTLYTRKGLYGLLNQVEFLRRPQHLQGQPVRTEAPLIDVSPAREARADSTTQAAPRSELV